MKSFALEDQAGEAPSRRWIETRLLTRQDNEWVGYSYMWNDDQTDATLVEAAGLDREFVVRVPRCASSRTDSTSRRGDSPVEPNAWCVTAERRITSWDSPPRN